MAKAKVIKGASGVANKSLHSRVSFLYQAAAYLTSGQQHPSTNKIAESIESQQTGASIRITNSRIDSRDGADHSSQQLARRLLSDLRSVSQKAQIRISPAMKRSICKRCDTMLIDGSTCDSLIENKSKSSRKPWADILVRECKKCGLEKRYPVAAKRQGRRPH